MKKFLILIILFSLGLKLYSQSESKVSLYFTLKGNNSVYDRVMRNSKGAGPGFDILLYSGSAFKPLIEFNWDIFSHTDVLKYNSDGKELVSKSSVPNIFAGTMYKPIDRIYFMFTAGLCFIRSDVYFGIKPGIGFYIDKNQRYTVKFSLTNIFQRDEAGNKPFGYLNLGIGVKIF